MLGWRHFTPGLVGGGILRVKRPSLHVPQESVKPEDLLNPKPFPVRVEGLRPQFSQRADRAGARQDIRQEPDLRPEAKWGSGAPQPGGLVFYLILISGPRV